MVLSLRQRAVVMIAFALLPAGCSGDGGPTGDLREAMLLERDDSWRSLTNADNGLAVRKWLIEDRPDVIAGAIGRHAHDDVLDEPTAARLSRNGLRLVRVHRDDLEAMLAALGGATLDVNAWHGQVLSWRSLHERAIPAGPRPIAVDGRVRRIDGGTLALLARAWTLQMEDGPYLQLEMVPEHRRPSGAPDLLSLLQQSRELREPMSSMSVDVRLRRDSAYVLTCEAPALEWTFSGASEAPGDDAIADPDAIAERETRPWPAVGPDVEAPLTVGQMLFWSRQTPPQRAVLVLIPNIPDALYAPEMLAEERGEVMP